VKEAVIANVYELKQISLARNNTDKIDAGLAVPAVEDAGIVRATLPPKEIQDLRGLYSTYRLIKKQAARIKNRIRSLLKELREIDILTSMKGISVFMALETPHGADVGGVAAPIAAGVTCRDETIIFCVPAVPVLR
jgi:hypothetical protein